MAAYIVMQNRIAHRRAFRRERVFRDRNNPLDSLNDNQLISRYRFPRRSLMDLIDLVENDLRRPTGRSMAIPPTLQVHILTKQMGDNCHKW